MCPRGTSLRSNPWIVMVSTPNIPDGLFEKIEREPVDTCLYRRLFLDYTYGLDRIYTRQEIEQAKASPSFEREYNLKYLGKLGNVFHIRDIEAAIVDDPQEANEMLAASTSTYYGRSMGIDRAWGTESQFAIVITQYRNNRVEVFHAESAAGGGDGAPDQAVCTHGYGAQPSQRRRARSGDCRPSGQAPRRQPAPAQCRWRRPDRASDPAEIGLVVVVAGNRAGLEQVFLHFLIHLRIAPADPLQHHRRMPLFFVAVVRKYRCELRIAAGIDALVVPVDWPRTLPSVTVMARCMSRVVSAVILSIGS